MFRNSYESLNVLSDFFEMDRPWPESIFLIDVGMQVLIRPLLELASGTMPRYCMASRDPLHASPASPLSCLLSSLLSLSLLSHLSSLSPLSSLLSLLFLSPLSPLPFSPLCQAIMAAGGRIPVAIFIVPVALVGFFVFPGWPSWPSSSQSVLSADDAVGDSVEGSGETSSLAVADTGAGLGKPSSLTVGDIGGVPTKAPSSFWASLKAYI